MYNRLNLFKQKMSSDERTLRDFLPARLRQNYNDIRNIETVASGVLNQDDIPRLQQLINDAQPQSQDEEVMRTMVQYLYRRDPDDFYKFLIRNHLFHLILWTEAKRMSRHFRLNNLIYIHWNGNLYECSQHSNFGKESVSRAEKPTRQRFSHTVSRRISRVSGNSLRPVFTEEAVVITSLEPRPPTF